MSARCAGPRVAQKCQGFGSGRPRRGAPSHSRMRVGDYPTPDLSRRSPGADLPPKKCAIYRPDFVNQFRKNTLNWLRGPSSRNSGARRSPILPHHEGNYEYMTYVHHDVQGTLGCRRSGREHLHLDPAQVGHFMKQMIASSVHGEGTRADGRRSEPGAQIDEIMGSETPEPRGRRLGAPQRSRSRVIWPVPQLKRLKRKFISQLTGLGPFQCPEAVATEAHNTENGKVGRL